MSDKQHNSGQKSIDAATMRKWAEEQARTMESASLSAQPPEAIEQMLHELRVQQIELEMQNEELRKAQVEIEAGRARYFDLYDLAPVGYCTLSEKGLILEANLTAATLLGMVRGDLIKQPISRFIFKEDQDIYYRHRKQLFETGEAQECDLRLVKPDGMFFWAHLTATAAQEEDGAPVCRVVVNEITERKQLESIIKKDEENLRNIADAMQETLSVIALNGTFLYANQKATWNMSGGKTGDIVGKNIRELISSVQAESLIERYQSVYQSGEPFHQEIKVGLEKGVTWFFSTLKPIEYGSPSVPAVLSVSLDITERKQAEAEREKLQVQLQQAQKMEAIGTLSGGIAHDFNNILGAILGYAEMAQEDSPTGSILRKDIDQIVKASHRAKDLVKQILAFSRQAETERIPLQPAFIIRETLKMLRSSLPSTIAIQQDIDQAAGPILADPTQIHQVMANLCTNAFHAMEETGGTLSICLKSRELTQEDLTNEPQVHPGRFVQLSIGDTGPGIALEIREKIFDPYFTTKEVGKGTGMGLAIIHGIAKSCKGFVRCHSVLGQGTVFHVYLPVIVAPAMLEPLSAPLDPTQLTNNERILFVDDEEILAEMGKVMLERLGYLVTVRKNSLEALHTFQKQPDQFDLVITDQTMPGMTGIDMARRMLQIRPGMPIILCSGYSSLISEDQVRLLGIQGFAMKPLAKKDIAQLIREVLSGEGAAMVDA